MEAVWLTQNRSLRSADIIKSDEKRRYVVPSAPGKRFSDDIKKVTDMLYNCNSLAMENKSIDNAFGAIAERYNGIISDLGLDLSLDNEFAEIKRKIFPLKLAVNMPQAEGEYLNGIVIAALLGYEFIDAATVIVFNEDGSFNNEKNTA